MGVVKMGSRKVVLQIGVAVPMLREVLERKYDFYSLGEQEDKEAFLAQKGPSIRCLLTCYDGDCPPTYVDQKLVSKLPNLELVLAFADTDVKKLVDLHLCKKLGVEVTDTQNCQSEVCASTAHRLLMAISRDVTHSGQYVRSRRWPCEGSYPLPFRLCNKHVGIVGLGYIGAAIARRMECSKCTIGYWSSSSKPEFPSYTFYDKVVDLAQHSDILIVTCRSNDETKNIINGKVLDALGPQGFLVNVSEGPVVDEEELVKALKEGRIAGAGLDVYENVTEELMNIDTCFLQPHAEDSSETHQAMANMVVANIEAHFAGKPLLNPVH